MSDGTPATIKWHAELWHRAETAPPIPDDGAPCSCGECFTCGDPKSDAMYPAPRAWIYDDDFRSGLIDFARKFRDRNHGPDALQGIVVLFARHWHQAAKAKWLALFAVLVVRRGPGTLRLLLALLAVSNLPRARLAADRRPADDLSPTVTDVRAHATLTAAPPRSRVPVLAGAAA